MKFGHFAVLFFVVIFSFSCSHTPVIPDKPPEPVLPELSKELPEPLPAPPEISYPYLADGEWWCSEYACVEEGIDAPVEDACAYIRILSTFYKTNKWPDGDNNPTDEELARYSGMIIIKKGIEPLREFLKDHYGSAIAGETKLRIAELLFLIGDYNHCKRYLDDIIEKNVDDDHWSVQTTNKGTREYPDLVYHLTKSSEKTAAWALYWRALWFRTSWRADLKRILTEYRMSDRVVSLALRLSIRLDRISGK
jgi:hypothetical protein